jgi:nucleoside-diphosphate-sugar epimerase
MKAFITGGSGFIGQHIIRQLVARGDEVRALARSKHSAEIVESLGAIVVPGDITDVESMRDGMSGCDVVFHTAGWYKLGARDWANAEIVNVSGTRKVLRLAHQLGIPKIVYTSSVVVLGDTQGELVDESFYQGGPFLTEYDRTKWLAHYKVALPLIEKGAPITIVMPGGVYGPGDQATIAQLMRQFYRGMPLVPAPSTTMTYAHVEDIAAGHLLAADKGIIGESYILTGPAIPLGEMVDFWAYLLGRKAPAVRIPSEVLRPFAPLVSTIGNLIPLPSTFSGEATASAGVTYMARSDKARRELGWETRPLQTGMLETFQWIAETEAAQPASQEKQLALVAVSIAVGLLLVWLLGRRDDAA